MIRAETKSDIEKIYHLVKRTFESAEYSDGKEHDLVNALKVLPPRMHNGGYTGCCTEIFFIGTKFHKRFGSRFEKQYVNFFRTYLQAQKRWN